MANIKQVNVIERIQQLFRQGISQRCIVLGLGVSHNTLVRCAVKPRVAAQFENPAPVPNMTLGVTQFDK